MTREEYWECDPWLIVAYAKAEKMRYSRKNSNMWMQGMYIYDAVGAVASRMAGHDATYTSRPYPLTGEETEQPKEQEAELELAKAKIFFENWANANQRLADE